MSTVSTSRGAGWGKLVVPVFASLFALLVLVRLVGMDQGRAALALAVGGAFLALACIRIKTAIVAVVVYLILLGDLRRALIPVVGWSETDPLLLVGSVFAIGLTGYAFLMREITLDTSLAKWMAIFMGILVLSIFNPIQGGLIVGVAGVIFLLAPVFWFWVGRTYGTRDLMQTLLFRVVPFMGIAAGLFGVYQVLYAYLPYQMDWYAIAGYTALGSPEAGLAPISFFASGTEHGSFLITTAVIFWAILLKRRRSVALLAVIFLLAAILMTGSRGPVAKVLITMCGMWAVMGRHMGSWMVRGALALLIAAAGLVWTLDQVADATTHEIVANKLDRQAQEFVDRQEGEYSSTATHFSMLLSGYTQAIEYPLGMGLGATTKAVTKFGGQGHSTETDLGNALVSTGLIGGAIYHLIVFLIIAAAFRYWFRTRELMALAIAGVLAVNFLLWLGGGQYAISPLVWLCVGALDRYVREERTSDPEDAEANRPEDAQTYAEVAV